MEMSKYLFNIQLLNKNEIKENKLKLYDFAIKI